jgi:hypothetical protein
VSLRSDSRPNPKEEESPDSLRVGGETDRPRVDRDGGGCRVLIKWVEDGGGGVRTISSLALATTNDEA